jgi:drug/metabolite transporter (DMT)-like permease
MAFIFLGLAFVLALANRLFSKYALDRIDTFALTVLTNGLATLILFPFVFPLLPTVYELSPNQIALILTLSILWTVTAWVTNVSITLNDFSFKEIIRQTRVLWVVLAGVFLLGEKLIATDILGIACIVGSVFIISYKKFSLREHIASKPLLFAWLSAFLVAIITILEKILLANTSALLYAFFAFGIPTVLLLFFLNGSRVKTLGLVLRQHKPEVLTFGVLLTSSYYTSISAYQLLPISIAYPIIQSSTVIGVLIGTIVFEKGDSITRKVVASLTAVAGVLIIQLL